MGKRFILSNPLIMRKVVEYVITKKKTVVVYRQPFSKRIQEEIDLSSLVCMINELEELPIEIPLVSGRVLSADLAEDVIIE